MTNLDVQRPHTPSSASAGVSTKSAEADFVLEFFSASHGKWIEVDIIDRNAQGDVQVSAKPGAWILAKDCKRKLRTRVFADDSAVGSTIKSPELFLESSKARSSIKAAAARANAASSSSAQDVSSRSGSLPGSPKKPMTVSDWVENFCNGGFANAKAQKSEKTASDLRNGKSSEVLGTGYPRKAPSTPTSGSEAATPKSLLRLGANTAAVRDKRPLPLRQNAASRKSVYSCPVCGAADLPSFELAVQHCSTPEQAASSIPASPTITDVPPGVETGRQRNGLRFSRTINTVPVAMPKEPDTERIEPSTVELEGLWNLPTTSDGKRQAKILEEHIEEIAPAEGACNGDVGGETDSTRSSEGQRPSAPPHAASTSEPPVAAVSSSADPLPGEAIAYNLYGEPIITRHVSQDTGVGVTTVLNEDGTKCTFGKNTLASLTSSDEADAERWVSSLTLLETRGLVHEIGQVLLSTSSVYQFHLNRLQAIGEKANYAFFGLSEDCSDADLDRAYKQMAKQMHPDKNGGTAAAKERFQQMKERYEALKQRRAGDCPWTDDGKKQKGSGSEDDDEDEEKGDDSGEDGDKAKEDKRKEAYDEDDDDAPKKEESQKISYDPTDQDSLATTAIEMLQRLKAIEGSMATVLTQLRMHGL